MTSKTVEERMELVEAQGQAMARQMAQIANLLKNALRIQPSPTPIPNDNQYTSSAPGTLVPNEDQPPSTPTPVPVPAAPPARVRIVPIPPLPASPPDYHRLHTSLTLILRSQ
jgi:hypothetical protein